MMGGFIGRALGWYGPNDGAGFFMSLLGAILLLWIYRIRCRPKNASRSARINRRR